MPKQTWVLYIYIIYCIYLFLYTVTTFKYVEGGTGPMAAEVVEDTCLVLSVYLRAWGGPRRTCPEVVEEILEEAIQ